MNTNNYLGIFTALLTPIFMSSCTAILKADLNALPEANESNYQVQIQRVVAEAKAQLNSTGKIVMEEKELSIAPIVAHLDFQDNIKLDVNVSALAEDRAWWGVPNGIWGFEYSVDKASDRIDTKLEELQISTYKMGEEAVKLKASNVDFPVYKVDLNNKLPSETGTVFSYDSPAFDAEDGLKVAQAEEGLSFFPYVNITFKKQGITMSRMNEEKVLNYEAAINGYFQLCSIEKCVSARFPNGKGIHFIMPLPHSHAYEEANRDKTNEFAQEFLGSVIGELATVAFNKLVTIQ